MKISINLCSHSKGVVSHLENHKTFSLRMFFVFVLKCTPILYRQQSKNSIFLIIQSIVFQTSKFNNENHEFLILILKILFKEFYLRIL